MKPHTPGVYRLWNAAGECLYVGKTAQHHPLLRVLGHRGASWWPEVARADFIPVKDWAAVVEFEEVPGRWGRTVLDVFEQAQIHEQRPKHNGRLYGYAPPAPPPPTPEERAEARKARARQGGPVLRELRSETAKLAAKRAWETKRQKARELP